MKVSRWMLAARNGCDRRGCRARGTIGVSKAPAAAEGTKYKVALVSDVAGFNDNGFNKNQLTGLKKAQAQTKLDVKAFPIVSHQSADYQPNYNKAIGHDHAKLIIAAGFLLARP